MPSSDDSSRTMLLDIPPDVLEQAGASRRTKKLVVHRSAQSSPIRDPDLRELFQRVYDAAFITTLTGRIIDVNVRALQFFDYTREEFTERTIADVILGLDEAVLQTVLQNLHKDRFTLIQAQCGRKDGSQLPAEISTSRLSLSSKDYLCFFVRDITARREAEEAVQRAHDALAAEVEERARINEDLCLEIIERKRVAEELNEAIARLREHDRAKSEFVSNVSHELKTPLASIRYMTENMLRGVVGDLPDRGYEYMGMIKEDCVRLTRTVEDILDMSRIEANTLKLDPHKVHFPRFVRQTAESLRIHAEAEDLTMTVSIDAPNGFVDCDPLKIERAIFNVVKNAIKFNMPGGSVDVVLHTDPSQPGLFIVDVVDSGIGIAPEHLDRVTERFFRVGEHISGTGLGLAICKELLDRHGGGIDLQSPPSRRCRGTQVSLHFPVAEPLSVLVVSDDDDLCTVAGEQLVAYGCRAMLTDSVANAFEITAQERPNVVLVDWVAPGMEGSITIGRLKSEDALSDVMIVAIVGEDADPVKQEILTGFAIATVIYPWQEADLFKALAQVPLAGV